MFWKLSVNSYIDEVNNTIEDIVWGQDGDFGLVEEFVEVCKTGKDPNVSSIDGAKALEVATAAYKSSCLHQKISVEHLDI